MLSLNLMGFKVLKPSAHMYSLCTVHTTVQVTYTVVEDGYLPRPRCLLLLLPNDV